MSDDARAAATTVRATAPSPTDAIGSADEAHAGRDEHGRVLAVDDNRLNRLTLTRSLEQAGHEATPAASGEEALELLARQPFDVVLLDLVMPGMDGFEVLRRIKADASLRDLPVVVVSAVDDVESAVRCIEMGAEDYLPKPFNAVLLRARVGASLRKKRLRDVERAYLDQEMALRQAERLATLGRLSAGMAHELNNPAAAARRAAAQLHEAVDESRRAWRTFGASGVPAAALRVFEELLAASPVAPELDPLAHSDRIEELEDRLDELGVEDAWHLAPAWIDVGRDLQDVERLAASIPPPALELGLRALVAADAVRSLVDDVARGTARVSELVDALKGYSSMDRAPVQRVDVPASLEATIAVLRGRFEGVDVRTAFADDLPTIDAYEAELNEVWSNLLENAAEALAGSGTLRVEAAHAPDGVRVVIEDDGPGIPAELLPRVFDPFVTSKAPGGGTGLGLTTAHAIVVQKHGGAIDVVSEPGRTRLTVQLPNEPRGE